ncbi:MFS transporter [Falsiroseomonas selenitidurans]|uniref:MFS transporter n=1 Tax=Falsiroseomonas selenitidurans TaxID=2716335 RepID=A0ABX1DXF0_9PROT|nr:MFS transporter [Falsiroseomonas selenitidurans]NKC29584.1 MFS transporter [Falsiroseomonas selenitidurans]
MQLPSALTPLRHPAFRLLWLANLCSNTGMWMQNTGAGWLMTSLAPSPLMVSMVQVASLLPVFLLALPAGALADIVDRRRYLIFAQAWIAAAGSLLAILAWTGSLGPWGLVALTFAIGVGTAMNSPAWAATTPETVPRQDLTGAIVLNGIGFNLARTVGPAIGGFTVAAAGAEATFALNALSFLAVIVALLLWKRDEPRASLPKEHFLSAIRAGLGYTRASPVLRGIMLRGFIFFLFAAALWGLLPLLVRQQLGLGPEWFGIMLAAMGIGAVGAGFLLPTLRARLDRGRTVTAAGLLTGAALVLLGQAQHWTVAMGAMLLYGVGWLAGASTLQAAAQLSVPSWVRARAIGIYQLVTFGGLTIGAALGGWGGETFGIGYAMGLSGALCAIGALLVRRFAIEPPAAEAAPPAADAPAMPRPEPAAQSLAALLNEESGRVLEVVRYHIDPADRAAFLAAMGACRAARLRSGALGWRLYEDVAHPERWVELWLVESWTEHLREEGRMTEWDRLVLARAAALHRGALPPEASRYLNVMPGMPD